MPPRSPNGPARHDVLVRAALANDRGFTSAGTVDEEQLAALEAAIAVADRDDTTSYAQPPGLPRPGAGLHRPGGTAPRVGR